MGEEDLKTKKWWGEADEDVQQLLRESFILVQKAGEWREKFHDYSFAVFPAAKAYEGFLKKIFLKMGFITQEDYLGKHFRLGKALNPSLDITRNRDSLYLVISKSCGGRDLADTLWETWKECRNLVFHWFPNERNAINLEEAREKIDQIVNTFDRLYSSCQL